MVNFPVTATLAFAGGAAMVVLLPNLAAEAVAGITSVAMLAFGAWFTPYSMAIWMFFEHAFHPLHKDDSYELPQESNL